MNDYEMAESADFDSVVESTERPNGDHLESTIDPNMIVFHPNFQSPLGRKGHLPILTHHGEQLDSDSMISPENHQSLDADSRTFGRGELDSSVGSHIADSVYTITSNVEIRIPPPPRFSPLPYSTTKTGLVYDARMRFHSEPLALMVSEDEIHPEDPRRIHEIFQEIQQAGLVQGPDDPDGEEHSEQCWRIQARPATRAEICLVHTPAHYKFIESLEGKEELELCELSNDLDSIYFHNSTFACAKLAVGGAIEACRAVVRGDVRNAIAIIRPPGHHAECDQPSGFCIFNNVPIATRVCQEDFPAKCRKVLILDWDVHHGNGIQHTFYDDPNVLYISLHVFKDGKFYPNLPDGNFDYCGEGLGKGKNVNIPWADHGMGDAEYIYAFQEIVMPIANEFNPDLVIISAGFDAAEGDVLGGCHVTPACYAHMTHMLMRLAQGKIAVCLEGGYNLRSIARSALAVTRTLMLQPPDRLAEDLGPPKESAVEVVAQIKREQSKYWKCMFPKEVDKSDPSWKETQRLHEIIREWQSRTLSEAHHMVPLNITKSGIAQTFQHNVIATPDFMGAHPLLVIFHDPPSLTNQLDPVSGRGELHNIWLTDATKSYVEWAISEGFQVIDVNVPKVVEIEEDESGFRRADDSETRAHQTRLLANYLWENYIEIHDATQVFLVGIGDAYLGLVDLLSNNESTTESERSISYLIGFVAETPIRSIKRNTDDNIGTWFYEHSLVFIADDHFVWDPRRQRKLKKRYGTLRRSDHRHLNDMLQDHREEVQELLLRKKNEYEEADSGARLVSDIDMQGLRSPPFLPGVRTPRVNSAEARQVKGTTPLRSPKLPPMGLFSAPSPRSPRSPMKRNF